MCSNISDFSQKVYNLTRQIPKGQVSTYKLIAIALGKPHACQAVGNALSKNPFPYQSDCHDNMKIPCHRVIASDGSIGGFLGDNNKMSNNVQKKLKLLKAEGIIFNDTVLDNSSSYRKEVMFTDFKI